MKYRNIIRIIDGEDVRDISIYSNNGKYFISLKDFRYYLSKNSEHSEKLNYRIEKAIDYIEKAKILAQVDKKIIISINTLENILKGSEE